MFLGNYPAGSETDVNEMSAKTVVKLAYHLLNNYSEVNLFTSFQDFQLTY